MKGFVSSRLHPFVNLLLLLGLAVATFCIAGFFATVFSNLFFGIGLKEMGNVTQNPQGYPQGWGVLMLTQGLTLFIMLAGAALALVTLTGRSWREYFAPRWPVPIIWIVAAVALIILSLPMMSAFIQWNANMHLPGFLSGFETWAREKEEELKGVTAFLTRLNSPLRLAVSLLVIAVVPAISEELFFRGVIQRNLIDWFKSRHVGVFLAAAIFSAIHMQFLGFVPRFVLGLILGYLYEWSGNILVPMAAHFTQNAFQLILLYVQQREWTSPDFNPDSTDSMPWYLVLLSVLFTGAILYFLQQREHEQPTEMHTLSSGGVAVASPETAPAETRTLGSKGADGDAIIS
jgi:membrane protease YdiL (CAAX protease family)